MRQHHATDRNTSEKQRQIQVGLVEGNLKYFSHCFSFFDLPIQVDLRC